MEPINVSRTSGRNMRRRSGAWRRAQKAKLLAAQSQSGARTREKASIRNPVSKGVKPRLWLANKQAEAERSMFNSKPQEQGYEGTDDKMVAIVPLNYPDIEFCGEDEKLVTQEILREIDAVPTGQALPRFEGNIVVNGVILVTCSDDSSREWLRSIVPKLSPWQGASLRVLEKERLVKVKVIFGVKSEETRVILRRLGRQNPQLQTHLWKVYDRKIVQNAVHLLLGVDERSFAEFMDRGFDPYFGLGRARFYLADPEMKWERASLGLGEMRERTEPDMRRRMPSPEVDWDHSNRALEQFLAQHGMGSLQQGPQWGREQTDY